MYPISFDNPNKTNDRNGGKPAPANRNIADIVTETGDDSRADAGGDHLAQPEANRLLVVECRRDDKWRVELCTDLSELDGALDMARALRSSPDVDEVCLTLEVSGENGRESRREVLRFDPESINRNPANASAPISLTTNTTEPEMDPEAMSVLNATLKVPDYSLDDLDFSQFQMPEKSTPDPVPDFLIQPVENLAQSNGLEEEPILVELPEPARTSSPPPIRSNRSRHRNTAFGPHRSDWLDQSQVRAGHHAEGSFALADEDNDDNAINRLESPLFSQQNGLATKLLVFAGTVALLVLGGALAELLAVDITTAANAGVGTFDSLNPLQSDNSR